MKKYLVSAAVMAVFGASSAFAQAVPAFGDNLTVSLSADVAAVCGAQLNAGDGLNLDIDFGDLTSVASTAQVQVGGGSITYVCNVPAGFQRSFSSDNGGFLYRDGTAGGSSNQIPWTLQHGGGSGLGFAEIQLTSARNDSRGGSAAFTAGQTGGLTFRANGVQVTGASGILTTNVFAGDYSDVMRITITPN